MKKRIMAVLMIFLLCFTASLPAQAAAKRVYVLGNTLPVYRQPKSGAKLLGTMGYGETLVCTAVSGGWARVQNGSGEVGYCKKSAISTANPNTAGKVAYINTANAPAYKLPSASSRLLGRLKLNSAYRVVAKTRDGKWYRAKIGSGYAYVPVKYMSANKTAVQTLTRADKIALLAKKQLGKPYAYGAESGTEFDCSGLTYYVYKNIAGVKLKRSAKEQSRDGRFAKITSVSKLKKGDLLCFDTGSGEVDHVGVYIGSGQFIHASRSAGKVITGSVNSGYYKKAFRCARRIA